MSDPTFASPERRSILLPLLLALVVLGFASLFAVHLFHATSVKAEVLHTDTLPTSTVYKAQSIVVGQNEVAQTLFVASTIRLDNGMHNSVSVDHVSLTLTDSNGAELTETALSKQDITTVEQSFPKLKKLVEQPSLQDTSIDPGKSVQGVSVFSLNIAQSLWDARASAVIKIDLYHLQTVSVTLPKP